MPIVIVALGTLTKGLIVGLEDLEKKRTSWDHLNVSIIKIGKNTEKSPGYMNRLALTQTLVEDH